MESTFACRIYKYLMEKYKITFFYVLEIPPNVHQK